MSRFRFQKLALPVITFLLLLNGCSPTSPFPTPFSQKTSTVLIPTFTTSPTPSPQPIYTLQRPDFQQLLGLISDVRAQAYKYDNDDSWQGRVTSDGLSLMDGLIADDLKRYYAGGIPGASQYIEKIPADWDDMFSSPTASINEILFHYSIIDYFNEKHLRFVDKQEQQFATFSVKPSLLSTDEKPGQAKWLLQIDLTKQEIRYWMTLAQDQNGNYTIIPNDIQTGYLTISNYETELITKVDINNDKKNDILLLQSYYFAGGLSKTLFIYTERNQGFYLLDSVNLPHVQPLFAEVNSSEYKIGDYNRDGLLDIQITTPEFKPFDCSWESKIIVQFNGEKRTDERIDKDIPDKPACNLANMLRSSDLDKTIFLLKSARERLPKDASSDLRSWIQLRLAIADYANGQEQDAVKELNAIARFSPAGSFQNVVQDAYVQSKTSPLKLCEILYIITRKKENDQKNFDSGIDSDLANFGAYPLFMIPIPEFVCPYIDIINFRLQAIKDNSLTPNAVFTRLGLNLHQLYDVNLDTDPDPEWISLLGEDTPQLVFIDHTDKGWQITEDSAYEDSKSNLQVKTFDVTRDGQAEVIFNFAYNSPYKEGCTAGKRHFLLKILDTINANDPKLLRKEFECTGESPIDRLSEQEIIDLLDDNEEIPYPYNEVEYPAWAEFQFNHGDSKTLLNEIEDLDKTILENTKLAESRVQIEALLRYLPKNDSAADVLRERLIYMTGLSYELQGDDENALTVYLNLIKMNPDSLWSKLARSRIVPQP